MVGAAQQAQVVERRAATLCPVDDVMSLGPGRWAVAAFGYAATVSDDQRLPNLLWHSACAASDVERQRVSVEQDACDVGIAAKPPHALVG